jgi:uncharacterized protein YjbJ (UPF0337 family)
LPRQIAAITTFSKSKGPGPSGKRLQNGDIMNKDRIAGAAKELKGSVKELAGKATGDAKLKASGKADKFEGKVQNAVGGIKDVLKR